MIHREELELCSHGAYNNSDPSCVICFAGISLPSTYIAVCGAKVIV